MRKKQQSSIPDQDNDNVYEIKSILAYEKRGNEEYFLVEWDGYVENEQHFFRHCNERSICLHDAVLFF